MKINDFVYDKKEELMVLFTIKIDELMVFIAVMMLVIVVITTRILIMILMLQ